MPIKGTANTNTTVSLKRINANTVERTDRVGGKVTVVITRTLSADGKTLTITAKGVNAQGQKVDSTSLYGRSDLRAAYRGGQHGAGPPAPWRPAASNAWNSVPRVAVFDAMAPGPCRLLRSGLDAIGYSGQRFGTVDELTALRLEPSALDLFAPLQMDHAWMDLFRSARRNSTR